MIPRDSTAAVIGASGGRGAAMAGGLAAAGFARLALFSRHPPHTELDLEDELSIAAAAASLDGPPLRLVFVATGLLHAPGLQPEKTYRALDAASLATLFRINTIGPALVACPASPAPAPRFSLSCPPASAAPPTTVSAAGTVTAPRRPPST